MNKAESFLTAQEERAIVRAIQDAETNTSGEIRVHIENESVKPTLERARTVFQYLDMDQTALRNGVLLYIGVKSRQFAIIGDEGINKVVPNGFWEEEKKIALHHFSKKEYQEGLLKVIKNIGEKLKAFFPYEKGDTNELPNEISKA